MAGISGVSPNSLAQLQRVLGEIGKGMDPQSRDGVKLDDVEAGQVVGKLGELPAKDQAELKGVITDLLRDEFISVTDSGRAKFAEAFQVPFADLTPREAADLAGLKSAKSVFQIGMDAIANTPKMDGAYMKRIVDGAQAFMPPHGQKLLAAILLNAKRDGVLNMDSNAWRGLMNWQKQVDKAPDTSPEVPGIPKATGTVMETAEAFRAPKEDKGVTAIQRALAQGGWFEDIIAAVMFEIVQDMQKETLEAAAMLDHKRTVEAEDARKPSPSEGPGKADGSSDLVDAIKNGVTKDGHPVTAEDIKEGRKHLEAIIQSLDKAKKNDGTVDLQESAKIVMKLDKLASPIDELIADATLNALLRTDLDLTGGMKLIVDWCVDKLTVDGVPPSLERKPPVADVDDPEDPIAKGLANSDKLEDKIAAFILQAFVSDKLPTGDKVKQLNKSSEEWCQKAIELGEKMEGPDGAATKGTDQAGVDAVDGTGAPAQAEAASADPAGPGGPGGPDKPVDGAAGAEPVQPPAGAPTDNPPGVGQHLTGSQVSQMKTMSRQELFEELKKLQQELSQALQALSNILNMLNQNAMNAIRQIR